MKRGFSLEDQDKITTKSQLKDLIREFCTSVSSVHLKVRLNHIRQYDFGSMYINFELLVVCLDDPFLDHEPKLHTKKGKKLVSCCNSPYVKDSFYNHVKKFCLQYWQTSPDWNNMNQSFSIEYYNDSFKIKGDD